LGEDSAPGGVIDRAELAGHYGEGFSGAVFRLFPPRPF
jgi:hypothetical protein